MSGDPKRCCERWLAAPSHHHARLGNTRKAAWTTLRSRRLRPSSSSAPALTSGRLGPGPTGRRPPRCSMRSSTDVPPESQRYDPFEFGNGSPGTLVAWQDHYRLDDRRIAEGLGARLGARASDLLDIAV